MADIVCDYDDFGLAVEVTMRTGRKQYEMEGDPDVFIHMVEQSYRAGDVPDSKQVKSIFEYSLEQAKAAQDENERYARIKDKALNWL